MMIFDPSKIKIWIYHHIMIIGKDYWDCIRSWDYLDCKCCLDCFELHHLSSGIELGNCSADLVKHCCLLADQCIGPSSRKVS